MTINQIVSAVSDIVARAREAAAEAAGRSYGAEREYAKALNEQFADLSLTWFTVEHNAKGAEAELIHAEKSLYFKALHAKHPAGKYPNPSVPWARVRKYAQEEIVAAFTAAEGAEGIEAAEGEQGEKVGARHNKSLTLRFTDELTTLYKAGRRAEKEGVIQKRESGALNYIAAALGELGIDISAL